MNLQNVRDNRFPLIEIINSPWASKHSPPPPRPKYVVMTRQDTLTRRARFDIHDS